MKWQQILERIKISIKLFGVGGEVTFPESELTIANRIIRQLEDRRVLIDPPFRKDVYNCVESVQQIRGMLTEELKGLLIGSKLEPSLQTMRSACRRFLTELKNQNIPTNSSVYSLSTEQASYFNMALGGLRETCGLHIGLIASRYKIDVDDDLASILPNEE